MTRFDRRAGVFLHPTSLPGPRGIGTLGERATAFVDTIADAGLSLWQVCPLGPVSGAFGNSPYQSYSAFAGNPLLIDLERLADHGLLESVPDGEFPVGNTNYEAVAAFKEPLLREAFAAFPDAADESFVADFEAFRERADWLDDYALFRALKDEHDDAPWFEWPTDLRDRDPDALAAARDRLADEIAYREFVQFCFVEGWTHVRERAADRGVDIVGDIPIYVAHDSADVWANRELFKLDPAGHQEVVSGVPPNDGDSGQKWGNPVYDWDALAANDFAWWTDRFAWLLETCDVVRLDHFRAFAAYWEIPAREDAVPADGWWAPARGEDLFGTVEAELGELPIIAEDLGPTDEETEQLRRAIDAPGMKVIQYADWCADHGEFLPHDAPEDSVIYPSTHDTNTFVGWYEDEVSGEQRDCLEYYLDASGEGIHWAAVEACWHADSVFAIAPIQDVLGFGSESRFNTPGTAHGNWEWRLTDAEFDRLDVDRLAGIAADAGRN